MALSGLLGYVMSIPTKSLKSDYWAIATLASGEVVRLFALIVPLAVASLLLGYPLLAAFGHENYANAAPVVGTVVHTLLVLAITPIISAPYVVWVFCVTHAVMLALQVYGVRKHRLWSGA